VVIPLFAAFMTIVLALATAVALFDWIDRRTS